MAFYLRFERDGEDLYPASAQLAASGRDARHWKRVRFEMLRRFGYFVTESSEHFSEYVPWFIKRDRPDLIERFNIPLDEYPRRCEEQIAEWEAERESLERGDAIEVQPQLRVRDDDHPQHGDRPAAGRLRQRPERGSDRQPARGLPVEVPCLVDRNGVQPTHVGALPPQLAALMQTNINVQELTVEAALTGKREHVYQAAMLDPHTAAELDLDQIHALVDDLIEAHGAWIPT